MPSKSFLKIVGLFLVLSLGPVSIYMLYKQTGGLESRRELAFHRNARFAFMSGTDSVDLKSLTDWPWARVCAFGPGLDQKEVNALVGFSYDNFSQLTWTQLEDHWTLLFIDSERETNWGMHRPVIPIRIPFEDIARYRASGGSKGGCVDSEGAALSLERIDAPVGQTPIVAKLSGEPVSAE